MNSVTFQLFADTEQKLRDKARKLGQSLEVYLRHLAETAVENGTIAGSDYRDANGSKPVAHQSEELAKRGFAVSAFVFAFRLFSYLPDGSDVPIKVELKDQRATEARSRFFGP